ncbi:MAG: adenylate kinase [Candidatus Kapabacteria bacterium]|nr:adenylate kinase [Candidatus Kapabacteria bacterium]
MLNIALFGPPGAGKGTQSEYLIKKYNLFYISTGDLLRNEISLDTPIGKEVKSVIASGGLVSDEIIVQIIEKTITENTSFNGFLFDGFPRTYVQAYILEGLMLKLNTSLNCLISIDVPEEESVKRLLGRGKSSSRSDDNESVIRTRLQEYNQKTLPVLKFFKDRGNYKEVNGLLDIKGVKDQITEIVKEELSKSLLNVVLFGYPGSGRSAQGRALAEKFGLEYLSAGEMLENEVEKQTDYGIQIKSLYDLGTLNPDQIGQLVPDEIVVQLIEEKISKSQEMKGFIFKGFPRTLVQSYILDGLLKKYTSSITKVIEIEVPTLELIRRLNKRGKTDVSRPYDSNYEKIIQRLQDHETRTVPVISKYMKLHGGVKIDGTGSFDQVNKKLSHEIEIVLKDMR